MAFAVVCKSCQARFLLNDDLLRRRVAGKVVTVRCRQCHAAIEVDASDVDPRSFRSEPLNPAPVPLKQMAPRPAPAPPRPQKQSTLMGIGSPARPNAATEMVALSAGFLNVAAAPAKPTLHGFPEPPPPPGAVEELNSGDWEIPDSKPEVKATPAAPAVEAASAPESLDDFVEELPPSLPPPEEDPVPSSSGTPSLKALTHHDEHAAKPRIDDFFANMSAAMNGGVAPDANGAPTIDISTLTASAETPVEADIDMTALDVPLTGSGKTLPLFALGSDQASLLTAPAAEPAPAPKKLAASPAGGSLSPASLDRPAPSSRPADSPRERKNVVAPATKSVPPPAPQKRSGLAAPVLLALAAVAGFLIWKRSAPPSSATVASEQAPKVTAAAEPAPQPAAVTPVAAPPTSEATPPTALAGVTATPPADDVTFETTPTKAAAAPAAAHDKPATVAPTTESSPPSGSKPAEPAKAPVAAAPKEEPAPAVVKEEPKPEPSPPAEPAGPFDRAAAAAALTSAAGQASACRKDGDPSGVASVVITFAPSGRVTSANVSGPPFAGTPTGGCIAAALRKARVPPFDGDRVTVSKTITIQ